MLKLRLSREINSIGYDDWHNQADRLESGQRDVAE